MFQLASDIKKWSIARSLIVLITIFLLQSCVTMPAPVLEYTLADTAIKAAKAVQAVRYSPTNWHDAEETYRRAQILFNEREYEQARDLFIRARIAAEKAETSARIIRQRNGEVL